MTDADIIAIVQKASADAQERREKALLDAQLADLGRLAALGMAMAEVMARRVTDDDGSTPAADLQRAALDFSRTARAVRMTYALQSRLIADFKKAQAEASDDDDDDDDDDDRPAPYEVRWLDAHGPSSAEAKDQAQAAIRGAAEEAGLDAETAETVARELRERLETRERLEQDDIWAALGPSPYAGAIARIRAYLQGRLEACADDAKPQAARGEWMARAPFPLDGGRAGDGGDHSASPQLNRPPHSRPRPHQGGEEARANRQPLDADAGVAETARLL